MFFIKKWLWSTMGFSRAESNGFVILLPLVAIIVFSEPFAKWIVTKQPDDFSRENRVLDSLVKLIPEKDRPAPDKIEDFKKSQPPVAFDPNTASSTMLNQVGFSNTTASRILKYRSRGGKFKIKSDLMKIYGIDSALYKNLYAFILLPDKIEKNEQSKINPHEGTFNNKKVVEKFDLNKADTVQLKTIYGIGPTLANRIVKYRLRLGGFITTDQLKEVYGLDSTTIYNLMKVSFLETNFQATKININILTEKELQAHPYITRAMAKAIIAYRFQHGNFTNVEELRNLFGIKVETANKLIPYLKVSD